MRNECWPADSAAAQAALLRCGAGTPRLEPDGPVAAYRDPEFANLLARARAGSPAAVGQLFEYGRAFLQATARDRLPASIRQKLGASDLVQETAIDVQLGFMGFDGTTEAELLGWMRRILLNNLSDAVRRYLSSTKRNAARERPYDSDAATKLPPNDPAKHSDPETSVIRREHSVLVRDTLYDLAEDYRLVLTLRYWEQCSFREIGLRMNRSADAARKLWFRAVRQFNVALGERLKTATD